MRPPAPLRVTGLSYRPARLVSLLAFAAIVLALARSYVRRAFLDPYYV